MTALILLLLSVNSSYFLKLSPGVRSQGLGSAVLMIDEGLSAFHNPAIPGSTQVNFTLSRWLFSTSHFSIGATFKNYVIGVSYLNYGIIQGYDQFGISTDEFTPYDMCLVLGRRIGAFGISLKTFGEKVDTEVLYGACLGISSYIEFGDIAIGAKIDNLGKEFSKNTNIPWITKTGVKFSFQQFEFIMESGIPDLEISAGIAYTHESICLLFGMRYLMGYNIIDDERLSRSFSDIQLSSGLIVTVEEYQIGYSFLYNEVSNAHQFSIAFSP
ncbi:MAG: hypothetical protein WBB37_10690 [bacterium]